MALLGKQVLIGSSTSNPGVLNQWLRNNNGYTSGDDLIESALVNINPKRVFWLGAAFNLTVVEIQGMLMDTEIVIANVSF